MLVEKSASEVEYRDATQVPCHTVRLNRVRSCPVLAGSSSCPAAAELAADLAELIVLHSDFQPLMAQSSAEPLPTAATQLAVPLTSVLPFVSMPADAQQQVTFQLRALVL